MHHLNAPLVEFMHRLNAPLGEFLHRLNAPLGEFMHRLNAPLVEFTYLVFTCMPGDSYRRRLQSLLLCLCYVFRALINSLVCWFCTSTPGLVLFQIATPGHEENKRES